MILINRQNLTIIIFRCFGSFGHLPKYYLSIFGVKCFGKIFSVQNFASYGTFGLGNSTIVIHCHDS